MTGIEYEVTHTAPPVFVLRKQRRTGPDAGALMSLSRPFLSR